MLVCLAHAVGISSLYKDWTEEMLGTSYKFYLPRFFLTLGSQSRLQGPMAQMGLGRLVLVPEEVLVRHQDLGGSVGRLSLGRECLLGQGVVADPSGRYCIQKHPVRGAVPL